MARTDAARAELNEMRIRAKEYDSLVKAYAMLTDLSNNQRLCNSKAREEFGAQIHDITVRTDTIAVDLKKATERLEKTKSENKSLQETRQKFQDKLELAKTEIVTFKEQNSKLDADRVELQTRRKEQVDEMKELGESISQTTMEIKEA